LLILLRESIARSGQFVPSQTRRFAKSRALASPAEVAACARETSNERRHPIIYLFAALCFSEFRKPVSKSLLMPERTAVAASFGALRGRINQMFPGIYCLVRRRFD